MNIDERLEKLTARTDALTHSVELLASMHKDNEKRMNERAEKMDQHMEQFTEEITGFTLGMTMFSQEMKKLAKRNVRLEGLVTDIAEGTARLLRAVEVHEQRISDLEGNQTQQ